MRLYLGNFLHCRNSPTSLLAWLVFLALTNTKVAAQIVWTQTEGPFGGIVRALAVNANGHIFAGLEGGGVFRSTDNGISWEPKDSGVTNKFVYALAVNANGVVFAGTERGLFRTRNNGTSWDSVHTGLTNTNVRALTIDTDAKIFAGTMGDGLFQSTNNGESWSKASSCLLQREVRALLSRDGHIVAGTNNGVCRSIDSGNSWTPFNNDLTNTDVLALALDNTSGDVFAGTNGGGVFLLKNNSNRWQPFNTGLSELIAVQSLAIMGSGDILAGTDGKVFRSTVNAANWIPVGADLAGTHVIAFAINASKEIFAGTDGGGVFHSIDNGDSWTAANLELKGTNVEALAVNAAGHVFAGTLGGVFRSVDHGLSWTEIDSGMTNRNVHALAITASGEIFAGTDGRVFRSTNNGERWTGFEIGSLKKNPVTSFAISLNGSIFAGTESGGVFLFNKDSELWNEINNGLTSTDVRALAIKDEGQVFAGTDNGVFRSGGSGDDWQNFNNNGLENTSIRALAINAEGHIFAGTDKRLFRSVDNGERWELFNAGLEADHVISFALHEESGDLFAGTSGAGAFLLKKNSNSWMEIKVGLVNLNVKALALGANVLIFAGTNGSGVFRSVDYPAVLSLAGTYNFPTLTKASDYKVSDYRIVGLPGTSNASLKDFLNGDQGKAWQIYWDNGSSSNDPNAFLDEFDGSETFRFKVGRAFWLINRDTLTIATTTNSPLNPGAIEAEIELHSGWNLITNPFTQPANWSAVQAANGNFSDPIHEFMAIGSFRTADVFEPYLGYYFFNIGNLSMLKVPLSAVSSTSAQASKRPVWEVEIGLASKDLLDQSTSFGIANEASPELDRFDYRKPRPVAAIPNAYFSKPRWDKNYSVFATDIRPEFEDKESWDFEVQSKQREELKLTFSGIARVPAQFEVYLIDKARSLSVNLRQDSLYAFIPPADISNFTVLVGKAEALQEQLQSIVPRELSLEQNYPNPFNPQTAIPVTIPATTDVQLKIYDLLGREVQTLHSGSLTPGRHFFFWNGRDESGNARPSGVYFYRLRTSSGTVLTHKMILMK